VVTICTSINTNTLHVPCIYAVSFSRMTAIVSLNSISLLAFITEMQCVFCDVRTELFKFYYTEFRFEMAQRFRQSDWVLNMSGKQIVSSWDKSTFYEVAQRQVPRLYTESCREMIAPTGASPNFAEQLVAMINRCRTAFFATTGCMKITVTSISHNLPCRPSVLRPSSGPLVPRRQ
jgi:hypothetical protein